MASIPSGPWGDGPGILAHRMRVGDKLPSRRHTRRLSRRFAGVGVEIAPERLAQIAAGSPVTDDEKTDVCFALAATEMAREQRVAKLARRQRRGLHALLVAGLVLVMLNFLLCMAYAFFSLTQHAF